MNELELLEQIRKAGEGNLRIKADDEDDVNPFIDVDDESGDDDDADPLLDDFVKADDGNLKTLLNLDGMGEEDIVQPSDPYLDKMEEKTKKNAKFIQGRTKVCGCYSCRRLFLSTEIKKINISKGTIICPYCKEKAVLVSEFGARVSHGVLWRLWARSYARTSQGVIMMPFPKKKKKQNIALD